LRQKAIPQMQGKVLVSTTEASNEVILEGADGPFRRIASVDMWGNKLKVNGLLRQVVLEGC
jgi:hypothetical protein